MVTVVSENKKCIFKYVNSKRKTKENTGLVLEMDNLTSTDKENMEAFNAFLASIFNSTDRYVLPGFQT